MKIKLKTAKRGGFKNGVNCKKCGIAGKQNHILICHKYGCPVEEAEKMHKDFCPYFIGRICEDGEPLTPQQHLLMSEQELSARHMKGPV